MAEQLINRVRESGSRVFATIKQTRPGTKVVVGVLVVLLIVVVLS